MNIKFIYYIMNRICMGVACMILVATVMAICYGDSLLPWLGTLLTTILVGWLSHRRAAYSSLADISLREGIATVVFGWLLASVLCALPFVYQGALDPVGALFESMSGLTTTGATLLNDVSVLPLSLLFWRSFLQWCGGIAIIVIFVGFLPEVSGGSLYIFSAGEKNLNKGYFLSKFRSVTQASLIIYSALTVLLFVLLLCGGMSIFDAFAHSVTTVATGGFSPYHDSIVHFQNPMLEYILALFMLLCGGSYALYYRMYQSGWRNLLEDGEFKVYVAFILTVTLLITLNICYVNGYQLLDGFRYAFFQTASFASTTGLVSYDYDEWPTFSKLLLALMYLTGGCSGSTAGGIKISRMMVLCRSMGKSIRHAVHPQQFVNIRYGREIISPAAVMNIFRFFFIYVLLIMLVTLILAGSGLGAEDALFAAASCVSNVGAAFGQAGAMDGFAAIPAIGKLALTLAMLLGRMEFFMVLVMLHREFWRKTEKW